jgi:hypothetical protein
MTTIHWTGREIDIDHGVTHGLIHLTEIRLEGNEDVPCPLEETEVKLPGTNVPKARQYVDRKIILGSRMALIASMQYSSYLANRIVAACQDTPVSEHFEHEGDANCPFIDSVSDRLLDVHEPIRQMRAFRDDFRYVLVYLPPWKVSYRIQRDGSDASQVEQARLGAKRPVYLHRECGYLWDFQRKTAQPERTIMGLAGVTLSNFDVWDDIIKRA